MSEFTDKIRSINKNLQSALDKIKRHAVYRVGSDIIEGSPIQTGAFVNNWYVFDYDQNPSYDWTRHGNKNLALARLRTQVAKLDLVNKVIYLKNPTPYHYVALSIDQVEALADNAQRDIKRYVRDEIRKAIER